MLRVKKSSQFLKWGVFVESVCDELLSLRIQFQDAYTAAVQYPIDCIVDCVTKFIANCKRYIFR